MWVGQPLKTFFRGALSFKICKLCVKWCEREKGRENYRWGVGPCSLRWGLETRSTRWKCAWWAIVPNLVVVPQISSSMRVYRDTEAFFPWVGKFKILSVCPIPIGHRSARSVQTFGVVLSTDTITHTQKDSKHLFFIPSTVQEDRKV